MSGPSRRGRWCERAQAVEHTDDKGKHENCHSYQGARSLLKFKPERFQESSTADFICSFRNSTDVETTPLDALLNNRNGDQKHGDDQRKSDAYGKVMRILMVLTSHDQLGNTGRKTGFWLEEFAAPYFVFRDAGVDLSLASPKGGQPPIDPKSDLPEIQTLAMTRFKQDQKAQ